MASRRNKRAEEQPREETKKESRRRTHERERNRKIMLGVSIALSVALLFIVIGLVNEFVVRPNSEIAKVAETPIVTRDFWKRTFLEQNRLQNQMVRMSQLEQQFGNQGFFASQIQQIQATLSSPFSLGVEVLDTLIREEVVRQQAAARGITVSADEIEAALREEVAAQQGAVTVPQATSTAEAQSAATATAGSWTPTPLPTVDANSTVTATATPFPTPEPPPALPLLTDEQYTTGLQELEQNLNEISGMSLEDYRRVIEARLLNDKLAEVIGNEQVEATEEQVQARHILLRIDAPVEDSAVAPTEPLTATADLTDTADLTSTVAPTTSADMTATAGVTTSEAVTSAAVTTAAPVTESTTADVTADVTDTVTAVTAEITATAALTSTDALTQATDLPTPELPVEQTRTEAEALALAQTLRARILAGEDFATLAAEYSDDSGSAVNGGDLGWFGRGAMVAPFEEAAFALEPGQISEPVRTDFGYHLIEVVERDPNRPKEESALQQERLQAYDTWLREQIAATPVERSSDLVSKLPRGLEPILLQGPSAPQQPAPQPVLPPAEAPADPAQ
jgi:parvulin-like peptidyl-prolyl isomerase